MSGVVSRGRKLHLLSTAIATAATATELMMRIIYSACTAGRVPQESGGRKYSVYAERSSNCLSIHVPSIPTGHLDGVVHTNERECERNIRVAYIARGIKPETSCIFSSIL